LAKEFEQEKPQEVRAEYASGFPSNGQGNWHGHPSQELKIVGGEGMTYLDNHGQLWRENKILFECSNSFGVHPEALLSEPAHGWRRMNIIISHRVSEPHEIRTMDVMVQPGVLPKKPDWMKPCILES
jgi:hypothetical protein